MAEADFEGEQWKLGFRMTGNNRMFINCEEMLDTIEAHLEEDCFCATCSWTRQVLLPGLRAASLEQETLHGLRTLPVLKEDPHDRHRG